MLNEVDGYFHTGELAFLGHPLAFGSKKCGCNRPLVECPVWGPVLERITPVGQTPVAEATRVDRLWRSHFKIWHLPSLLIDRRRRERSGAYEAWLESVYHAVAAVTGAVVIIDSTKIPMFSFPLSRLRTVNMHLLHLVRDPRAVVYSWETPHGHLEARNLAVASIQWLLTNITCELIGRVFKSHYTRIRYEDFTERPHDTIGDVLSLLGGKADSNPMQGSQVHIGPNHVLSGNPLKGKEGVTEIRRDTRWMRSMPRVDRILVSGLTWILARRYGYQWSVPGPSANIG